MNLIAINYCHHQLFCIFHNRHQHIFKPKIKLITDPKSVSIFYSITSFRYLYLVLFSINLSIYIFDEVLIIFSNPWKFKTLVVDRANLLISTKTP